MMPTLAPTGEAVIENRLICVKDLRRGDIITYASPAEPGRVVCKRIVGLPGDIICVDPTGQMAPTTEHVVVPKGHFWMCGDNAMWSRDSRWYGPVSQALVKGKLVAKVRVENMDSVLTGAQRLYRYGRHRKSEGSVIISSI